MFSEYFVESCAFENQKNRAIYIDAESLKLNLAVTYTSFSNCSIIPGEGGSIFFQAQGNCILKYSCAQKCFCTADNGAFIRSNIVSSSYSHVMRYCSIRCNNPILSPAISLIGIWQGTNDIFCINSSCNYNIEAGSGFSAAYSYSLRLSFCSIVNNTSDKRDVIGIWYNNDYIFRYINCIRNNIYGTINGILSVYGAELKLEHCSFMENLIQQVLYVDIKVRRGNITLIDCSFDQKILNSVSINTSLIGSHSFKNLIQHYSSGICDVIIYPSEYVEHYHDFWVRLGITSFSIFLYIDMNVL